MITFKILGPINIPFKQIGLANLDMIDLELLCGHMKLSVKLEKERYPHW